MSSDPVAADVGQFKLAYQCALRASPDGSVGVVGSYWVIITSQCTLVLPKCDVVKHDNIEYLDIALVGSLVRLAILVNCEIIRC